MLKKNELNKRIEDNNNRNKRDGKVKNKKITYTFYECLNICRIIEKKAQERKKKKKLKNRYLYTIHFVIRCSRLIHVRIEMACEKQNITHTHT